MTRHDFKVAHVALPAGCTAHPVTATPSGVVWGWDGPIPDAVVVRALDAGWDAVVTASPEADEVVVPVRDVLIAEPYGYSDHVERPEALAGRNGEHVFVFHEGILREAVVDVHIERPSVGVSYDDAAMWSRHVTVVPAWSEVVEVYLGFKRIAGDTLTLDVPAREGERSLEWLVMTGPNRPDAVLRALRDACAARGFKTLWDLIRVNLDLAADAFINALTGFMAGGAA